MRRIPERSCVGCRAKRPKSELVRVSRLASGEVAVDTKGVLDGRGAYLCPDLACWDIGINRRHIDRTLKTTLSPEARRKLLAEAPLSGAYTMGVKK